MKKYLLMLVTSLLLASSAYGVSHVTLAWDASPSTNVIANYKVYYGPASGFYTNAASAGTNLTVTVSNLMERTTYYFAATATDVNGQESDYSTEISTWTNPLKNVTPTITITRNGVPRIAVMLYPEAPVTIWVKSILTETQWVPLKRMKADAQGMLVYTDRDAKGYSQRYYKIEVTQ